MQCSSCKEEVSPKFTHALSQNCCPFCGQLIVPEKLKTLLNDFKILMDEAKEFPDQINEWLLTNYQYKKIDPEKEMVVQRSFNQQGQKITEETVFSKLAGIAKFKKKDDTDLKHMVGAIQSDEPNIEDIPVSEEVFVDEQVEVSPEVNALSNTLFPTTKSDAVLEVEKLRKFKQQTALNGGGGAFKRHE